MPIPKVAHQGIKLALTSLYNELGLVLERINGFWFRYIQLGPEGRRLAEFQEKNIRSIQIFIMHVMVAFRWELDRAAPGLNRINQQMEALTNADGHAYLKQFFSKRAIRQWDRSQIGQDINILDDIYLKWFDMCWMASQQEFEITEVAQSLPARMEDFVEIVKTIAAEKRSWRDWFKDIWAWLKGDRPASYTSRLFKNLAEAKQTLDAIDYTKKVTDAIYQWRELLDQSPDIARVEKWRWLGASYEAVVKGVRKRLRHEMDLPHSAVPMAIEYRKGFYLHPDRKKILVSGPHIPATAPSKSKKKQTNLAR